MTICFVTIGDITNIATLKRALGMANPLHELGWKVSIIAMDCPENRKRIGLECNPNVKACYYQPGKVSAEIREKTRLVNEEGPRYIYLCSYSFRNRLYKRRLKGKPQIIIEHSELQSGIPDNTGIRKLTAYYYEYASVLYADMLICASKYLVNTYLERSHRLYKRFIPILYSPYAFTSNKRQARQVYPLRTGQTGRPLCLKQYGEDLLILYMGTMTRNYGLFSMIDAMKIVRLASPGIRLLLMGRGRHLEEARKYVLENNLSDCVEFLGYVPEEMVSLYFNRADAFVSPLNNTVQDNARCPSKIYMYLPFKKPVFTCKIGEPKEIFGEAGLYFVNDYPHTLARLILDLKIRNLSAAPIRIEDHSWDNRSLEFHQWIKKMQQTK